MVIASHLGFFFLPVPLGFNLAVRESHQTGDIRFPLPTLSAALDLLRGVPVLSKDLNFL